MILNEPIELPAWLEDSGENSDIVISTRLRLARNIGGIPFPDKSTLQEQQKIFHDVSRACTRIKETSNANVYNFIEYHTDKRELFAEERAIPHDFVHLDGDRGVIVDDKRKVSVLINEDDHVRMVTMDSGMCAQPLWQTLDSMDCAMGKIVPFAYDSHRGFLTSSPANIGTGLRVSFLAHLVGLPLTKNLMPVLQGVSQTGISTKSFLGENHEIVGNLFQFSNHATLGISEEEILSSTMTMLDKVVALERQARERILSEAALELEDKVYRALGILTHARTLEYKEFLNLSSALRIGIDCGIIKKISRRQLNYLFLHVMPAHLRKRFEMSYNSEDESKCRAEAVRRFLENGTF